MEKKDCLSVNILYRGIKKGIFEFKYYVWNQN